MSNTYLGFTVIFSNLPQSTYVYILCTHVCISVAYFSAVTHACPWMGVGMYVCVCVWECVWAHKSLNKCSNFIDMRILTWEA